MRILHLIDGERAGGAGRDTGLTLAACAAVVRHAPGEHEVVALGNRGLALRAAGAAGVRECAAIAPPLGNPLLGTRPLRRLLLDREPDVALAWSLTALAASRRALPELPRACVIADGAAPVSPGLRALRSSVCGVIGASLRAELIAGGVDGERVALLPAPSGAVATGAERASLRDALGLGEDDVGIVHLGAAPYAAAMRFVFLLSLLCEAGTRAVGIVSARADQVGRALALAAGMGSPPPIIVVPDSRAALPAADLAVYEGGGHGPAHRREPRTAAATPHLCRALAAGVPLVAPRGAADDLDLPETARRACLGVSALPTELARVALPLVQSAAARDAARAALREVAARACGDGRFALAVSRLWTA